MTIEEKLNLLTRNTQEVLTEAELKRLLENNEKLRHYIGFEISGENKRQLLIPRGFAHGFSVLSKEVIFLYKCDNLYHPEADRGINFNDPELNIDWGINTEDAIISAKDKILPDDL